MKKKVLVFTGSRADYGILQRLIKQLKRERTFQTKILVGSHHFSSFYGNTFRQIKKDKINIDFFIKFSKNKILKKDLINYLSRSLIAYKKILEKYNPNIVIILGDRYEALSLALCCFYLNIPIAHIHGGEVTHGSLDDTQRHMISKLSSIHFPSHYEYKKRLIQLGENKKNIFLSGSLGVENIRNISFKSKKIIYEKLKLDHKKQTLLITFHPETISKINYKKQIKIFLNSLVNLKNLNLVFTFSNSDPFGFFFIKKIQEFENKCNSQIFIFKSLGRDIYLNLMKYSKIVIGNSSSGIIETPVFNVATLNIGERQSGRFKYSSVVDCHLNSYKINNAIKKILLKKNTFFKNKISKKNTSFIILKNIKKRLFKNNFQYKKFYDIKF